MGCAPVPRSFGFAPSPGDVVYKFDVPTQNFVLYSFDDLDLVWAPSEPSLEVGESVFILERNGAGVAWNRNFDVTP